MSREPFSETLRRAVILDPRDHKRVEPYDLVADQRHVGLGGFGLLVLERVADQQAIQRVLPAIEPIDLMIAAQHFDPRPFDHLRRRSKTLGFSRSFVRRGFGRAGASSAAWNAAQRSTSRPKRFRSGNVSSARASALSRTNSLTERCAESCHEGHSRTRARLARSCSRGRRDPLPVPRLALERAGALHRSSLRQAHPAEGAAPQLACGGAQRRRVRAPRRRRPCARLRSSRVSRMRWARVDAARDPSLDGPEPLARHEPERGRPAALPLRARHADHPRSRGRGGRSHLPRAQHGEDEYPARRDRRHAHHHRLRTGTPDRPHPWRRRHLHAEYRHADRRRDHRGICRSRFPCAAFSHVHVRTCVQAART